MSARLPEALETERLLLRPVAEEDLAFFVELHGDPEVMRFLGHGGKSRSAEETRAWLDELLHSYREDGIGQFAIVRREDGRLIGRSGMSHLEIERAPSTTDGIPRATWGRGSAAAGTEVERKVEVGYVVHPGFQGSGYATEAARRWMAFALEERGEPEAISIVDADNAPSLRVAEKNGLERTGTVRVEGRDYRVFRNPAP